MPKARPKIDARRTFFLLLGLTLLCAVHFSPSWADAVDPNGKAYPLTREGKAAIALFLLAATWWIFEVIPIGITSIAIAVVQLHFLIYRTDSASGSFLKLEKAFRDFMDPSVWFIFGSLTIGMVFTKTGLTRRLAYKMLVLVGERTSMIYLGCFTLTAGLTLIMAHTAVAATVFPLLMAIYSLYDEEGKPTKFGKGLFIGMAYMAGAGSIITLLGSARAAVAIGFFKTFTDTEISFFELPYYMLPLAATMVFLMWVGLMIVFKPERARIEGLREKSRALYAQLGPMSRQEILAILIVAAAIGILCLKAVMPSSPFLQNLDKSAVILTATILFFVLKILTLKELEELPWNTILLFGGAMSIGFCLWETGAAQWLAVEWLVLFQHAHWLVFILGIAFFVLVMTNFIMNVAAIAISLPVALVLASYLNVAGEVVLYASLVTAGMPFLCLVGAAPNAIAYESKQFTAGEFFVHGSWASVLLIGVLALFVAVMWPLMGMPVLVR
ncbi:MAG: SLC13 family permease [Planctomycetota bacterium]